MLIWNYPKTIEEAAGVLDAAYPNWRNKIYIKSIDMEDDDNCILGQLYGSWRNGIDKLFSVVTGSKWNDEIFGASANKKEWIKMIQKTNEVHNWNWALTEMGFGKKVRMNDWPNDDFICIKNGFIVTNGGGGYIFSPSVFRSMNWEILPEWTLFSIPVGMKFKVKQSTPSIDDRYVYQKIESPIGYDDFVCFINGDKGVFHAEPIKYAQTIEVIRRLV